MKLPFGIELTRNKAEQKNAGGNIYGIMDYQTKLGLMDNKGDKNAMLAAYTSWVYACVTARAQAVANAKFRIYKREGADDYRELDDHPALKVLERPNPLDTRYDLLFKTVSYMDLTGDAYWEIVRDRAGRIRELWVLPSNLVTIVPSKDGVIERYDLKPFNGSEKDIIRYSPSEIIHHKHPNPNNFYYGASVIMAVASAVDINDFQHDYQKNFYKRSALPPAVLESESKLDDATVKRLRQSFDSVYGGGDNAGKTLILENGLKYKPLGISPKDLDYLATNSVTMKEICAIFRVPPSMLGIVEDVNRANAESQEYTFAKMATEPLLRNIDERLTTELIKQYLNGDKLFIQHDSTVPEDEDKQASAAQKRIFGGLTTINEERKLQGYKPVENGDVHLVPTNYMPLNQMIEREVTQEGQQLQNNQQQV